MTTQGLLITLLDPIVLPSQAATASRMETLTYLPGATLLGIAAEKLYDRIGDEGAFHSGAVRFEDAFPLNDNGHLCLPAPISLHRSKGESPTRATSATDFATAERTPAYKQIRGKDVVLDGSADFFTPKRMASMRTAINFDTGLADEGQLYGYEALSSGQRFRARVSGPVDWVAQITEALCGEHFIGRSKTAEFGRVRIEEDSGWKLAAASAEKGERFVWFLSDAWLYDANGLPTARPEAGAFNAKTINWARSFVRTRRVAPYNATWNARGEERELITRGSVLTLTDCDLSPGEHRFGMGQERGNGLVFVSTDPLVEVLKRAVEPIAAQPLRPPKVGSTPFSEWLEKRLDRVTARQKAAQEADADFVALRKHYAAARRIAGEDVGPTSSQWAGLASRLAADISVDKMLGDSDDQDSKLWGARFDAGKNDKGTFRGFVKEIVDQDGGPERLRHLARKMRRAMDDPNWPDQKTGGGQ